MADEFQARGMEQKLMDYFGGPDPLRRGLTWADDAAGSLNVNNSWRWRRTDNPNDSRAAAFKRAYTDEQLFSDTLSKLFDK
jgi:hypothetical protein